MTAMNERIFLESGKVRDGIPHVREVIYVGRNGQKVERIQVNVVDTISSFIYKPLTNYPNKGKEVWLQANLFVRIPEVNIPKILFASQTLEPEKEWMVFEDLGELEHNFSSEMMLKTSEFIPYWHLLPTSLLPEQFEGHTPKIKEIQRYILAKDRQTRQLFERLGFRDEHITYFYEDILRQDQFENEIVIAHGDLYPLNIAEMKNQVYIFDWEYAHTNSVFWDLYTLMDITSPQYRRLVIQEDSRLAILARYISVRENLQSPTQGNFISDYHKYSALYSFWLLLLIEEDIAHERFEKSALLQQYKETLEILKIVFDYLKYTKGQLF
ncbi:phosphotransferase [Paenibacillus sp. LMG 31461]|uniref:Phosphotransferase n=1 Tax=Paenibacillus plantarum TaxID=2654975 RepID=A0ABX1X6E3_9BACL|nr:phosphotransferase [Paenibacillus plantarum]NOU63864.1 phosphotransferase [Paenibacillus plantarum]